MMKIKNNSGRRGFLIYLSVLFAGLALLIGLFILNVTRREIIFSGYNKESDYAFYAAETGAECALYWDLNNGEGERTAFPLYNGDPGFNIDDEYLVCSSSGWTGSGELAPNVYYILGSYPVTTFRFNVYIDASRSYCAEVTVGKMRTSLGEVYTSLFSNGYNVDCNACCVSTTNKSDKLQRTVGLTY